jgi:hypothetical protein
MLSAQYISSVPIALTQRVCAHLHFSTSNQQSNCADVPQPVQRIGLVYMILEQILHIIRRKGRLANCCGALMRAAESGFLHYRIAAVSMTLGCGPSLQIAAAGNADLQISVR